MSGRDTAEAALGLASRAVRTLAQSAVAASLTGTTTETALATIVIPAGSMGPNGQVEVAALWSRVTCPVRSMESAELIATTLGCDAMTKGSFVTSLGCISMPGLSWHQR